MGALIGLLIFALGSYLLLARIVRDAPRWAHVLRLLRTLLAVAGVILAIILLGEIGTQS